MSNSTQNMNNSTFIMQVDSGPTKLLSVSPCLIFLCINGVMLFTLRSKPVFRETSRYILLFNLIFTETLQLVVGQVLFVLAVSASYLIRYVCVIFVIVSALVTNVSPFNLAVMSLERYVAVCYPLRHSAVVTLKNTGWSIAAVWFLCLLNIIAQMLMLFLLESRPLGEQMQSFCAVESIFQTRLFYDFATAFTGFTFISVGIVIICSYFGVMIAAKSASSDKASSKKAVKTLLLHMIQLLLTLSSSLVSPILSAMNGKVDRATMGYLHYVFFVCFINLPRCLSGLIYGLRDQTIRTVLLYHLSFGLKRTVILSGNNK